MALAAVHSCLLRGLEGRTVEIQVDISAGKPAFNLVGLATGSVREAKERVRSAIRNSGLEFPSQRRLTVNLAPAELPKQGSALDLAVAPKTPYFQLVPPAAYGAYLSRVVLGTHATYWVEGVAPPVAATYNSRNRTVLGIKSQGFEGAKSGAQRGSNLVQPKCRRLTRKAPLRARSWRRGR
jgi:hypothetical protein